MNFTTVDYCLFAATLCLSLAIGIYFGCFGNKQKYAQVYLYGKGNMKALPVGLSLFSGAVSSISIIGLPTDIYVFGTQFMLISVGSLLSLILTWTFILPVFYGAITFKTPYEYFEVRYNRHMRLLSSVIYIVNVCLYMPVVLYASTLAVSEATGTSLVACTTLVGGVCVFYTVLGGFSSVIWTDTLQALLIMSSSVFVMCTGINRAGGFSEVWRRADHGGRIQFFNMNPNPLERMTFWTAVVGMCFNFASHSGCSASTLQRYMSLPNLRQAKVSTVISAGGFAVVTVLNGLIGLTMYARYYNCDPVANKEIYNSKQLLPHYIADITGTLNGFFGFFIAGLLSAGLSSMSSELNTVGGLFYHDFFLKVYRGKINEKKGAVIIKIIVLLFGILIIALSPLLQKSPNIYQISLVFTGITYGAKLGSMILGTACPRSNSVGAICGVICSILFIAWMSIGSLYYNVGTYALPVSTSNCTRPTSIFPEYVNSTTSQPFLETRDVMFLYKISFMYYPMIGTFITVLVGLAVSYATGPNDVTKLDSRLLIPYFRTDENLVEMNSYLYKTTRNTDCIED